MTTLVSTRIDRWQCWTDSKQRKIQSFKGLPTRESLLAKIEEKAQNSSSNNLNPSTIENPTCAGADTVKSVEAQRWDNMEKGGQLVTELYRAFLENLWGQNGIISTQSLQEETAICTGRVDEEMIPPGITNLGVDLVT
ncbi:hypothetical protein TNCV_2949031 [Trichonephila clavipes]|nr:hypothetical protein TNCV_2949031 [Trichonephila clavipes]